MMPFFLKKAEDEKQKSIGSQNKEVKKEKMTTIKGDQSKEQNKARKKNKYGELSLKKPLLH
jgi:hypothetical protein